MTRQVIPAQNIITCDACGCTCNNKTNYKRRGVIQIHAFRLDLAGEPMVDTNGINTRDFCDSCLDAIEVAIAKTATERWNAKKDPFGDSKYGEIAR